MTLPGKSSSRPFVSLNMAMTADGKIATANRRVSSFGSSVDQRRLYLLRARADAVMCGAATVNEAGIDLNAGGPAFQRRRLRAGLAPENLRILVSGSGLIRPDARVLSEPGGPVLLLTTRRAPAARLTPLMRQGVRVGRFGRDRVDFPAALRWLHDEFAVRHLHVEGGGTLNGWLLEAGLIDEIHLTLCPVILGGASAPTIAGGPAVSRLAAAHAFHFTRVERVGDELFLTLEREPRRTTQAVRARTAARA
ncbi:MAG TPA: 2,5-diamino-6-(ribosylamino)-4(3H)-pyrimidinone 5'-phosphate reductase [Verrucomicrobiales bacterium]|nr:2,5-diamino-6-(ribosylamino)-4(3H)-pyrimidinone 5'-phosphate reductase [Verrucomicrobiales bacterium]